MKKTDLKRLICLAVSATVVFSLSVMSFADEPDEEDAIPVETAEQEEGETVIPEDEAILEDASLDDEVFIEEDIVFEEDIEDVEVQEVSPSGPPANGWYKATDGYYYYYSDGVKVTSSFVEYKGKTYYCDNSGIMVVGLCWVQDELYAFGLDGAQTSGWIRSEGIWYYFDPDNNNAAIRSSLFSDSKGNSYYFDENGFMATDEIVKIRGVYYYFNNKGVMQKDYLYTDEDGFTHYFGSDGIAVEGWKKIDGKYYYFSLSRSKSPI